MRKLLVVLSASVLLVAGAPLARSQETPAPNPITDFLDLLITNPDASACAALVIGEVGTGAVPLDLSAIFARFDACMTQRTGLPFPTWIGVILPLPPGFQPPAPSPAVTAEPIRGPRDGRWMFFRETHGR